MFMQITASLAAQAYLYLFELFSGFKAHQQHLVIWIQDLDSQNMQKHWRHLQDEWYLYPKAPPTPVWELTIWIFHKLYAVPDLINHIFQTIGNQHSSQTETRFTFIVSPQRSVKPRVMNYEFMTYLRFHYFSFSSFNVCSNSDCFLSPPRRCWNIRVVNTPNKYLLFQFKATATDNDNMRNTAHD